MADSFNTEAFTLLGVGVLLIALRTIARIRSAGFHGLAADDYLMVLAAVRGRPFTEEARTYVL